MITKPYVVIRKYGYYVNIIPNEKTIIRKWQKDNLPGNVSRLTSKWPDTVESREAASRLGLTFTPVTLKGLRQVKAYARK